MDPTERRARISEEAAEWWVRLRADDLRREEREQFVDWLRESSVHVAEMLRIAQVNGALESFTRWARVETGVPTDDANVVPLRIESSIESLSARSRTRTWINVIAASVGALAIAVTWFAYDFGGQTIKTERGERREVALADGSVLQVSPESKFRVSLEDTERRITLYRGAALFRVAKDPKRFFVVQADQTVVRAVGTAFGVERRDQGVVVTVSEGRVEVEDTRLTSNRPAPKKQRSVSSPARPLMLVAGEQIAVPRALDAATTHKTLVRQVDTARELAWAEGRLVFESDTISNVIAEFNRYNRVQLHVTDDTLARRPISGVFDASDPESFIAFVASVAPVRIKRDDGQNITFATP